MFFPSFNGVKSAMLTLLYFNFPSLFVKIEIFLTFFWPSLQCRRILASKAASLIKRAPSWIQTWKRLGEGQKGILESRSEAKWGVHVTPLFRTPPCPQFLCQHGVKSTQSEANTNNSHAHRKHPHCGLVVLIFPSSDEFDEFLIYFYLIFFSPHRVVEKVLSLKTLLEETFYQEVIQV